MTKEKYSLCWQDYFSYGHFIVLHNQQVEPIPSNKAVGVELSFYGGLQLRL